MKTETQIQAKELLDSCYLLYSNLTAGQMNFYDGCKRQYKRTGELSEKQVKTLSEILRYLPKAEQRFTYKNESK